MKTYMRSIVGIGAAAMLAVPLAQAGQTNVAFSTKGNGTFDVTGIHTFDWQASGDLVVENVIPDPNNCRVGGDAGVPQATFAAWAGQAEVGDTCAFNIYAHSRLTAFKKPNQQAITTAVTAHLSKNGLPNGCASGADCFEVTGAVDALETATLVTKAAAGVNPKIQFKSITGQYKFFLDGTPDSNVANPGTTNPTTFTDGKAFLEGVLTSVTGSFTASSTGGGGGSNYIVAGVSVVDPDVIKPDNPLFDTISGASFDTLVQVGTSLTVKINVGQGVGLTPYIVLENDLRFKADANSIFEGFTPPEELLCRVTGGGRQDTTNSGLLIANNENNPFDEDLDSTPHGGTLTNETPFPGYTPCVVGQPCANPDEYTFGGQAGAPTHKTGVFGEWEHSNHEGPSGSFTFKMGSHSNPPESAITAITCSDPPACVHAKANGEFKQLDFEGTGTFRNLHAGPGKPTTQTINGVTVQLDNNSAGPTLHYARVHIEDLGEDGPITADELTFCLANHVPGSNADGGTLTSATNGTTDTGAGEICTKCPDIYQIEIHETALRTSPVMYTVGSYTNKGNLQIHRPTGNPN